MKKGDPIRIERVANGFIVMPAVLERIWTAPSEVRIFPNTECVSAWLELHFADCVTASDPAKPWIMDKIVK